MLRSVAIAALVIALPASALADELCEVQDGATKISEDRVKEIAASAGYADIRSVGEEDGCFEAKGMNRDGKKVEVYVHPVHGDIVKIKLE